MVFGAPVGGSVVAAYVTLVVGNSTSSAAVKGPKTQSSALRSAENFFKKSHSMGAAANSISWSLNVPFNSLWAIDRQTMLSCELFHEQANSA